MGVSLNRFAARTPAWSFDQGSPTLPDLGFSPMDPTEMAGLTTPSTGGGSSPSMVPPHHPTVADAISFPSRFLMTTGRVYGYANASPQDSTPSAVQARNGTGPSMGNGFTPQASWDNMFRQGQIDIPAQRDRAPGMTYSWDQNYPHAGVPLSGPTSSTPQTTTDGQPLGTASVQAGEQYKAQLQSSLVGSSGVRSGNSIANPYGDAFLDNPGGPN